MSVFNRGVVALAALLVSTGVHAGLFRAYLSSTGSDTNPCTLQQPCRLLPAALGAVDAGGEVWMLDSANYNNATVTIGKSVSILSVPGAVGSVVSIGSSSAIYISASDLKVALRNLVVGSFQGQGTHGVEMNGSSTLLIDDSLIGNLPGDGVYVIGTGKAKITNTIIRDNGAWAVYLQNGASAGISGTRMLANSLGGVGAYGSGALTTATVSDSIISGGSKGVYAYAAAAGANVKAFVTRCTIEDTEIALHSETSGVGSSSIAVSGSMITKNYDAYYQAGAGSVIRTFGNNHIFDNVDAGGSLTPAPLQ